MSLSFSHSNRLSSGLLLAAILIAVGVLAVFPKWTVDDAYISFRYAANLAEHGALTWNVGEDPVEGYTGVALPVAMAAFIALGMQPVVASQLLGIVSFFAAAVMLFLVLGRLRVAPFVRACCVLLFVTAPCVFTHALSGLETMLFTALVITVVFLLLSVADSAENTVRRECGLLLAVLAACFVRPEGMVLAGISICALWLLGLRDPRRRLLPMAARILALFALPFAIYFVWRWNYYGQILPNTFYAKTYDGWFNFQTTRQLVKFSLFYLAAPVMAVAVLHLAWPRPAFDRVRAVLWRQQLSDRAVALCAVGLFVAVVLAQYHRSLLVMNYAHRFFLPMLPLALVAIGLAAGAGVQSLVAARGRALRRFRFAVASIVILAAGQAGIYGWQLRDQVRYTSDYKQSLEDQHLQAGRFLKETIPSYEWLIVHMDAGAIPYTSRLKTADFGVLNDEVLSRGSLTQRQITDYFYSFDAAAVVMTSFAWDRLHDPRAAALYQDPRFRQYVLVKKYRTTSESRFRDYHEFVYVRKDLASATLAASVR